ncbi:ribosome maturation factor RimP [Nitrosophilus alvini]|uniref:ribosome maturation factor RimP n=1 Tax=Nitrosophilus alvini TaxID=2714855 RepID=UPI00190C45A9|nr:ribosome maturation factor RimP [Nitrosophilus alvini]
MSLESEIRQIVEDAGVELYDIETVTEHGKTIYRIYIKSKNGIDLDKCAQISNLISPLLDVTPPVKGEYYLEVSSPGVERKLKKLSHFENSIGESVKIVLNDGTVIKGKIEDVKGNTITLLTDHGKEEINFNDISSAKTYFEW